MLTRHEWFILNEIGRMVKEHPGCTRFRETLVKYKEFIGWPANASIGQLHAWDAAGYEAISGRDQRILSEVAAPGEEIDHVETRET